MAEVNLDTLVYDQKVREHFAKRSDAWLQTRYHVLRFIQNGNTDIIDTTQAVPRLAFPNGYDPDNHMDDNIRDVRYACETRGVPTS